LSQADISSLDVGDEVTKAITVRGLMNQASVSVNVKLRKCFEDYQVYLTKAPVAFSGFCVGK